MCEPRKIVKSLFIISLFTHDLTLFGGPRHVAHGILGPQPRAEPIEPVPPAVEEQSFNCLTTREVPHDFVLEASVRGYDLPMQKEKEKTVKGL